MTGQEDFFEAALAEDGTWNVERALVEINTPGNEGAPTVRGDGRHSFLPPATASMVDMEGARAKAVAICSMRTSMSSRTDSSGK